MTRNINIPDHDMEGRVIAAEFDDFILVNVYVPNSGEGLKRLEYRAEWDTALLHISESLRQRKKCNRHWRF